MRTERFFKPSYLERLCTKIKKEKGQQKKKVHPATKMLSFGFAPRSDAWLHFPNIWKRIRKKKNPNGSRETISEGCGHKPVPFMTSQRGSAGKRAAVNDFVQQRETYACHVWRLVISTASLCVVLTTCREKLLSPLLTVWTIYLHSENIRHDWY